MLLSSRRYIKRVWRVPKTRGPVEYLATIITKALVKHGWPAKWQPSLFDPLSFLIVHDRDGLDAPADFANAVSVASRICARSYNVDVTENFGLVTFSRAYVVTEGGHFREVKP